MPEAPELTPEHFEILVVRELRKVGLEVSALQVHRRATLPEPERGYLLELRGRVSRGSWQRRVLIACRRQETPTGGGQVESFRAHLDGAGAEAGILFSTGGFDQDAVTAAPGRSVALPRVADRRTGFEAGGAQLRLKYSPAEGQVSILHLVAVSRNGRASILVQRFEGPTADTAVQAGMWASAQLGRRPAV